MSQFFIGRPIFAWVIAIVVMISGGLAITGLPVSMYPDIAPPTVTINARYPGASSEVVVDSMTQVIEQNLKSLDGLLYMSSRSSDGGGMSISLTFDNGVDPDIAQVQVQNKVQLAMPLLPFAAAVIRHLNSMPSTAQPILVSSCGARLPPSVKRVN